MTEYRFSIGDSNTNGLGLCFSVKARTEDKAVEIANELLSDLWQGVSFDCGEVELVLYAGPKLTVTASDIADVEDGDDDED
jgi:hypothetical protein